MISSFIPLPLKKSLSLGLATILRNGTNSLSKNCKYVFRCCSWESTV